MKAIVSLVISVAWLAAPCFAQSPDVPTPLSAKASPITVLNPENYTRPLFFEPKENGVEIPELELEYELDSKDSLKLGNTQIDSESVGFDLTQDKPVSEGNYTLQFSWPKKLLLSGLIELRGLKDEKSFFSLVVEPGKVQDFLRGSENSHSLMTADQGYFEPKVSDKELLKWVKEPFRFCMKSTKDNLAKAFCSRPYILMGESGNYQVKDFLVFRREELKQEKLSKKHVTLAKDETSLNLSFCLKDDPSKIKNFDLPISSEKMLEVLGNQKLSPHKKFMMKALDKNKKSIEIGTSHYDKNKILKRFSEWGTNQSFKFCVGEICSEEFTLMGSSRKFIVDDLVQEKSVEDKNIGFKQEVLINESSGKLKDNIVLKEQNSKISLRILLSNGAEYFFEVQSPTVKPEYFDVIENEAKDGFIFSARGPQPLSSEMQLMKDGSWKALVKSEKPFLYFNGLGDVPLKQPFKVTKKLATEELRPYVSDFRFNSTYKNSLLLKGQVKTKENLSISSTELEAKKNQDNYFEWNFKSDEILKDNRDHLRLVDDKNEFLPSYSIYRGLPYEVVARFSGILAPSSILFSGELAGSAWFERILKNENPRWSVLRWGAEASFRQSLNSPQDGAGNSISLSQINVNLKYRLTPGVINRDQTWGGTLDFQNVSYISSPASMLGIGVFWNHPVFQVIDTVFNKVKWFRNPKWLEAYFQYYPLALSSQTSLGGNYNLGGRLKIFLKPKLFYDFGIYATQLNYSKSQSYNIALSIFGGTVGLGYDF